MVLTLGSPPEKGGKKETLVLTLGSPPEKGEKKKTMVLTLGSPPKRGGKKKRTSFEQSSEMEVLLFFFLDSEEWSKTKSVSLLPQVGTS
jgi:hypothetical protein